VAPSPAARSTIHGSSSSSSSSTCPRAIQLTLGRGIVKPQYFCNQSAVEHLRAHFPLAHSVTSLFRLAANLRNQRESAAAHTCSVQGLRCAPASCQATTLTSPPPARRSCTHARTHARAHVHIKLPLLLRLGHRVRDSTSSHQRRLHRRQTGAPSCHAVPRRPTPRPSQHAPCCADACQHQGAVDMSIRKLCLPASRRRRHVNTEVTLHTCARVPGISTVEQRASRL
jgi:hypothetical protein